MPPSVCVCVCSSPGWKAGEGLPHLSDARRPNQHVRHYVEERRLRVESFLRDNRASSRQLLSWCKLATAKCVSSSTLCVHMHAYCSFVRRKPDAILLRGVWKGGVDDRSCPRSLWFFRMSVYCFVKYDFACFDRIVCARVCVQGLIE